MKRWQKPPDMSTKRPVEEALCGGEGSETGARNGRTPPDDRERQAVEPGAEASVVEEPDQKIAGEMVRIEGERNVAVVGTRRPGGVTRIESSLRGSSEDGRTGGGERDATAG